MSNVIQLRPAADLIARAERLLGPRRGPQADEVPNIVSHLIDEATENRRAMTLVDAALDVADPDGTRLITDEAAVRREVAILFERAWALFDAMHVVTFPDPPAA